MLVSHIKKQKPELAKSLEEKINKRLSQVKSKKSGPGGISDNVNLETSGRISIETIDENGNVLNSYSNKT
jgi:hypothetical protein